MYYIPPPQVKSHAEAVAKRVVHTFLPLMAVHMSLSLFRHILNHLIYGIFISYQCFGASKPCREFVNLSEKSRDQAVGLVTFSAEIDQLRPA